MQRRIPGVLHDVGGKKAIAWVAASLAVICVVVWHDSMVKSYWEDQYANNSLFLTQRHFESGREPSRELMKSYPIWLAIMRYEADLSVGLLAASFGIVLVNAVGQVRIRRAWAGPGVVACVVVVGAMVLCVMEEVSLAAKGHRGLWNSGSNPFPNAWPHFELRISVAVLGAWIVMAGIGRWRPRREWTDWLGVVIGFLWIGVMFYRIGASLFIPFDNWGY